MEQKRPVRYYISSMSFKPPVSGSWSPWGVIDSVDQLAPGAWFVSTPGHGGIRLAPWVNRKVHWVWRKYGGWYEEDCDWSIPAVTFGGWADDHMFDSAVEIINEHYAYESLLVFGSRSDKPDHFQPGDLVRWVPKVDAEHLPDDDTTRVYAYFDDRKVEQFINTFHQPEFGTVMMCTVIGDIRCVSGELCYRVISPAGEKLVSRSYLEKF